MELALPRFLTWRRPAAPPPVREPSREPLPRDLLKKVRRIEIATNRLVDQGVAGDYHSVFKGRGMEFLETRPYQPGDDIRAIDWNVTARLGEPFVKQYVEERDLTVFLVVDTSGSLGFGSRALLKRELAAEIAALLAFAALRNQDRVGAGLVSGGLDLFLPPRRRRTHVLRLVREVLFRPNGGGTDLGTGLSLVLKTLKRRSVLFVISDFLSPGPAFPGAVKAAAARHDLIAVEITDPRDLALPPVGPVVLADAETGRTGVVDGRRLQASFTAQRAAEGTQLRQLLRSLAVDHLELSTERPYLGPLLSFFERRRRRLSR
jgi:uncharacterized protein (DUF58 family)